MFPAIAKASGTIQRLKTIEKFFNHRLTLIKKINIQFFPNDKILRIAKNDDIRKVFNVLHCSILLHSLACSENFEQKSFENEMKNI